MYIFLYSYILFMLTNIGQVKNIIISNKLIFKFIFLEIGVRYFVLIFFFPKRQILYSI